jgi:hypothetical protein
MLTVEANVIIFFVVDSNSPGDVPMPSHASSTRPASKASSPMRLMRRLRDEVRAQANLASKEAKSRWKSVEGRLEHPEKWVQGARKVVRKARHRMLGLRSELLQAFKGTKH